MSLSVVLLQAQAEARKDPEGAADSVDDGTFLIWEDRRRGAEAAYSSEEEADDGIEEAGVAAALLGRDEEGSDASEDEEDAAKQRRAASEDAASSAEEGGGPDEQAVQAESTGRAAETPPAGMLEGVQVGGRSCPELAACRVPAPHAECIACVGGSRARRPPLSAGGSRCGRTRKMRP
jgi:hypothetical protein